jgi:hydroxyacylglutathione hydrolase
MQLIVCPLKVKSPWIINYCYLIIHRKLNSAIIVDPAWELKTIENTLQNYNANLKGILLTHHHFDHIDLADTLASLYQIPVFMSKAEIDYYKFRCVNLNPIIYPEPFIIQDILIKPIFTPGHTYGGTSYLIENNLFCGDTLFIEGCGICFGKGANPHTLFDSLQTLKKEIPLDTYIYPGHSYGNEPGKSFEFVLKNNIYLSFQERESFVAYRMRKNQNNLFNFK